MADAPAIFKRKSSKVAGRSRPSRTFESKNEALNDTEPLNGEGVEGTESPSVLASKLKKKARTKPKAPVASSKLSFNDEGDEGAEDEGQAKKASLSRRALVGAASGLPTLMEQATITTARQNNGPVYDAQYLSELKAGHAVRPPATDDMDVDSISGGIITVDTDNLPIATGNIDASETVIPTTASIAAAKDKRGRLRTAPGAEEDFISLSLIKQDGAPSGPHPNSRLVREEDELGEGDDEFAEYTSAQERIALGKKSRKKEAVQQRQNIADLIADADEVDEETAEWELEQLRRGGHAAEPTQDEQPVYQPAPIPEATSVPVLVNAMGRLTASLTQLTASHASSATTLAQLAKERLVLDEREAEVRRAVEDTEGKRAWFAAFREWIEGVAAFLDEKYPALEKLENEHCSILRERAGIIDKRRRQEDEDDLATFLGDLPLMPQSQESTEQERDDRDSVMYRPKRRAARTARRDARARARAKPTGEEEGFSTDAELDDSEAEDLRAALSSLSSRAREILSDVRAPEFRDPSIGHGLSKWFGEWRSKYEDIYVGAWGGLGLVGAWELWARLEMAQGPWSPLETLEELAEMRWFHGLHQYSRPKDQDQMEADGAEDGELGPEGDLAAAMVGTAVIPRVVKMLENGALDPFSLRHVRRIIDFSEQAELLVERGGLKFQMLLQTVSTTFETEAGKLEERIKPFLKLNKLRFDPAAIPARRRLLARMGKLVTCSLRWRKFCGNGGQSGLAIARTVGRVTECMLKVAETGWDVGGEEIVRKVVNQIPPELVSITLKTRLA